MYGHLHVLHFILYSNFTASLYDGKYAWFYMGVMRSISSTIRGIARQMGASNEEGIFGQWTSIDEAFRLGHRLCDMVREM